MLESIRLQCDIKTSTTTLAAAVASTGVGTWTLTSLTNVTVGTILQCDREFVRVTAVGTPCSVTRAMRGSSAALHDNGKVVTLWYPLQDYVNQDRIMDLGNIVARNDVTLGHFEIESGALVLDNADGFFSGAPVSGLTTWWRATVLLSLSTSLGDYCLGQYLVDEAVHDGTRMTTTWSLLGKGIRLKEKKADLVKQGRVPYRGKNRGYLIQRLLETVHTPDEITSFLAAGTIQQSYVFPLAATTLSADGTNRALSHRGTPPEVDGHTPTFWGNPLCFVNDAAAPAALKYKVITAMGSEVWAWDLATGWVQLGDLSSTIANVQIHKILYSANRGALILIAWQAHVPATTYDARKARNAAVGGTVRFVKFTGTTFTAYTDPVAAATLYGANALIWTGMHTNRAGGWGPVGIGQMTAVGRDVLTNADAASFGYSMPMPWGQWLPIYIFTVIYEGYLADSLTGTAARTGVFAVDMAHHWKTENAGWAVAQAAGADYRPLNMQVNCGQHRGAFACIGQYLYFYAIEDSASGKAYQYRLWRLDLATAGTYYFYDTASTWRSTNAGVPYYEVHGGVDVQPYSLDGSPDSTKLLTAGAYWGETVWAAGAPAANQLIGHILEHPIATPDTGVTAFFDASGNANPNNWVGLPEALWIPLAAVYAANGTTIGCTFLDANANTFVAAVLDTTQASTANRFGTYRVCAGLPAGCVYDSVAARFYWLESGNGVLISQGANTTAAVVESFGDTPVDGDATLCAGLVFDPRTTNQAGTVFGSIYGISGPGIGTQANPDYMELPLEGRFQFWEFGPRLSDYVDVAAWGDNVDCFAAAEKLTVGGDFVMGYDPYTPDAPFVFQSRTIADAIVGTLRVGEPLSDTDYDVGSMSVEAGYRDRYPIAYITPGRAVRKAPTGEITLITRPASLVDTNNKPIPDWSGDRRVVANTDKPQNLFLLCVQGGTPGGADFGMVQYGLGGSQLSDTAVPYHGLRFSWVAVEQVVESYLLLAVSGGSVLRIPYAHSVDITAAPVYGDTLELVDPATNASATYTIQSLAADPLAGYTDLTITGSVAASYDKFQRCTIRTFRGSRPSDGDHGITTLAAAVTTTGQTTWTPTSMSQVTVGMILRAVHSSGYEDVRVTSVDLQAGTCEVVRGCGRTTPSTFSAGDVLKGYYAPIVNATWPVGTPFAVGDTGLSLILTPTPKEGSGHVPGGPFIPGDSITVTYAGLVLDTQTLAPAVGRDQQSIKDVGEREFPGARATPFLGPTQAREVAARLAADYGPAHTAVRTRGGFILRPRLGDAYLVQHPTLLPWGATNPNGDSSAVGLDTMTAIAASIRGWSLKMVGQGGPQLELTLRALNPRTLN